VLGTSITITKYGERNPGEPTILTDRNASHCIDLLAKDSADVKCFKEPYEEVKSVMTFLTDGKIKGLKDKLIERGNLTDTGECNYIHETRFNRLGQLSDSVCKQKLFLDVDRSLQGYISLNQYCTRQGDWKYVFELDRVGLALDDVGEQEELGLSHVSECWIK
jgi:hypothetical protein